MLPSTSTLGERLAFGISHMAFANGTHGTVLSRSSDILLSQSKSLLGDFTIIAPLILDVYVQDLFIVPRIVVNNVAAQADMSKQHVIVRKLVNTPSARHDVTNLFSSASWVAVTSSTRGA